MIAPGLPVPGHESVELPPLAHRHHVEARFAEGSQVAAGVGQEVDGALPSGPACGLDARGVVGAVAVRGFRGAYLVGPDDVGVAVPGSAEGVDQGEIPPPPLHKHHVPERAPVMQYRGVTFHVAGHGFDRLSSPEVAAAVVYGVRPAHTDQGYGQHQEGEYENDDPAGGGAGRQAFRPPQYGTQSRRDAQPESQESGDEEHVEILDAEMEVHHGLAETTEEERAE